MPAKPSYPLLCVEGALPTLCPPPLPTPPGLPRLSTQLQSGGQSSQGSRALVAGVRSSVWPLESFLTPCLISYSPSPPPLPCPQAIGPQTSPPRPAPAQPPLQLCPGWPFFYHGLGLHLSLP